MMHNQTTILQKLQAGEISLEEAERLLAQLDATPEPDDHGHHKHKGKGRHHWGHRHNDEDSPRGFPFGGRGVGPMMGFPFGRGHGEGPIPPVPPMPPFPPMMGFPFGRGGHKRGRHMHHGWAIRTSELMDALARVGIESAEDAELETLRHHGIHPEYIHGLADAGIAATDIAGLIALRNHGVRPDFVRALSRLGFEDLSVQTLAELASYGLRPNDLYALKEFNITDLTPETLIELASYGVRPRDIEALKRRGMTDLSADDLIAIAKQGYGPGVHDISTDGISGDDLIEMARTRLRPKISAHISRENVPTAVAQLSRLLMAVRHGHDDQRALDTLASLGVAQFTESFAQEMAALGYESLTPQQLVDLWAFDINPADVREILATGATPTLGEIIETRRQAS